MRCWLALAVLMLVATAKAKHDDESDPPLSQLSVSLSERFKLRKSYELILSIVD